MLDALLSAAGRIGEVRAVVRRTQVSLAGPLRTFAIVQSTARRRVDVSLRLTATAPGGRVVPMRGEQYRVRLQLQRPGDVDAEATAWLRRAYDENAVPRPRRRPGPRPRALSEHVVHVVVEGFDLPGRSCAPDVEGQVHENVHVGLQCTGGGVPGRHVVPGRPWTVVGLVAGDAPEARWDLDVTLRRYDGYFDVRGPFVRGPRGDRGLGLSWGDLSPDGSFQMFRGLGLRFNDIAPALLDRATEDGMQLVARLGLTDAKGHPRCASVRPPDVEWSVEPAAPD